MSKPTDNLHHQHYGLHPETRLYLTVLERITESCTDTKLAMTEIEVTSYCGAMYNPSQSPIL